MILGLPTMAAVAIAAEAGLNFDSVFSDKGEPLALHYDVTYFAGNQEHHLEVWRDGQRRLKRNTDGTLETYIVRAKDSPEFSMSVLDLKKHMSTRIDRTNLYKIGNFTDWFDLAHGLKHPTSAYQLLAIQAPANAPELVEQCDWYALTREGRTAQVCWSKTTRIPLAILGAEGHRQWLVTAVDRSRAPPGTFDIHDAGFIRNDANEDIDRD